MFYSPKGNREAYTEPHSKVVSVAQTKEHSPARETIKAPSVKTITGHHPQIRTTTNKAPSQIKSKAIYSTKDSYNYNKMMNDKNELEYATNSFLEESYMKNLSNNHIRKEEMSFESSN